MIKTLILIAVFIPSVLFAQETVEKINARVLPTVWFSMLDVKAGDKIQVYAGLQNNSGSNFSGTAIFYANDKEFGRKVFSSNSDSLLLLSSAWNAEKGKTYLQVKVDANLAEGKSLIATETERVALDISEPLTLEEAAEKGEEILSAVKEEIDQAAEALAVKLDEFKKPVVSNEPTTSNLKPTNILSKTIPNSSDEPDRLDTSALTASVFNAGIDLAKILLRYWPWTISGLALFYIIFRFR